MGTCVDAGAGRWCSVSRTFFFQQACDPMKNMRPCLIHDDAEFSCGGCIVFVVLRGFTALPVGHIRDVAVCIGL